MNKESDTALGEKQPIPTKGKLKPPETSMPLSPREEIHKAPQLYRQCKQKMNSTHYYNTYTEDG